MHRLHKNTENESTRAVVYIQTKGIDQKHVRICESSSLKFDGKMIKKYLRKRWRIFADYTTLHGVKEIYKAPRKTLRFLWILILAACATLMMYQIYKLTVHFLNEPVTTTVTYKNDFYPLPLLLLVARTSQLFSKEHAVNYTGKKLDDNDALIYARSLIDVKPVHVRDGFDFVKAKRKFDHFLQANPELTWHDVLEPYVADISPWVRGDDQFRVWQRSIWSVATYHLLEPVTKPSGDKDLNQDKIEEVEMFFDQLEDQLNLGEPLSLLVTSYGLLADSISLTNGSIYKVRFEITTKKRVPLNRNPCKIGATEFAMYDFLMCTQTCLLRAKHRYARQKCYHHKEEQEWGFYEMSKILRPCSSGFTNSSGGPYMNESPNPPNSEQTKKQTDEAYQKCVHEKCQPQACESLNVKFTTTTREFSQNLQNKSIFFVQWPAPSVVTVYEEALQYTWDGFVGQLGGLIGLWMGASMMSAFEAFYLCCCCCYNVANDEDFPSEQEDQESMFGMNEKKDSKTVPYKQQGFIYAKNGLYNMDEMKKTEIWLPRTIYD